MLDRVQDNNEISQPFPVSNEVKQGCVIAPTLFSSLFYTMLTDAFREAKTKVTSDTVYRRLKLCISQPQERHTLNPISHNQRAATERGGKKFIYLGSTLSRNLVVDDIAPDLLKQVLLLADATRTCEREETSPLGQRSRFAFP